MVAINYANREVSCKIVYYGPGLSGKTTNLQYIHSKVPNTTRGDLISLATDADRTLYFDFLPINIGSINGFTTRFQLYTVPGQVFYNATRKLVLRGVDGLIFVADSQRDKADENVESLNNLKENLDEYGYALEDIPIILQYNKVDLPEIMTVEEMDQLLNSHNWPTFTSVAHQGKGVFDTLKLIIKMILENVKKSGTAKQIAEKQGAQPAESAEPQPQSKPVAETEPAPSEYPQKSAGGSAPGSQPEPARDGRLAASAGESASSVAVADMPQQDPNRQDMQATDKIKVEQQREAAEAERAEAEAASSNDPARQEDTYIGQKPEQQEMSADPEPDEQTVETDETRAEEDQDLMIKRADQESYVEDQPQDKPKPEPEAEEIQPTADYDEPEEVTEMPEETPAPEEEEMPEPVRDEAGEEDDEDEYEEDIFALPTERPKMAAPLKAKKKKKGFFLFRLFKKK